VFCILGRRVDGLQLAIASAASGCEPVPPWCNTGGLTAISTDLPVRGWMSLQAGRITRGIVLGDACSFRPLPDGGPPMARSAPYPPSWTSRPIGTSRVGPLVQWLLAIPQLMIAYTLSSLRNILTLIGFFTVLFTKRIPRPLSTRSP
jgi:hypothetical protein